MAHWTLSRIFQSSTSSFTGSLHNSLGYQAPAGAPWGCLYGVVVSQASTFSYLDTFWLLAVIFAALAPLVFLLRKPDSSAAPPAH